MQRRRAFTLIELLVVISIIALLISILLPALRKARDASQLTICGTHHRQIVDSVTSYAVDHDGWYPVTIQGRTNAAKTSVTYVPPVFVNYWADNPTNNLNGGSIGRQLGYYLPSPEVLRCPLTPGNVRDFKTAYLLQTSPIVHNMAGGYFMTWGFPLTGNGYPAFPQRMQDVMGLMTADYMAYGMNSLINWECSHPLKNSIGFASAVWPRYVGQAGGPNEQPQGIELNGSFSDGHVVRYRSEEAIDGSYNPQYRLMFPPVPLDDY